MCGSPAFLGLDKASVSPKVKHSKEPLHLSSACLSCGCDSNTVLKACLCDKGQLQQMRTGGRGVGDGVGILGGGTGQTAHVDRRLHARVMQDAHGLEGSHPRKLSWGKGALSLLQGLQDSE